MVYEVLAQKRHILTTYIIPNYDVLHILFAEVDFSKQEATVPLSR